MRHFGKIAGLLLLLFAVACNSSSEKDKLYKEAFDKQQLVIAEMEDIEQLLESNSSGQGDSIKHVLHELEEDIFEIPGYSLELPGHEGHDHSHGRVELTAEQMVTFHEELLQQLKDIKSNLGNNE